MVQQQPAQTVSLSFFYLAMGTWGQAASLQRKAGCPLQMRLTKVGSCSEDEDMLRSWTALRPRIPGSLEVLQETWNTSAAGMAVASSSSSWLSSTPAGCRRDCWAGGSQQVHFSRCQTTSRLVLKNGLRKVRWTNTAGVGIKSPCSWHPALCLDRENRPRLVPASFQLWVPAPWMEAAHVSLAVCSVQTQSQALAEAFQEFCQILSPSHINRDFAVCCQRDNPKFATTEWWILVFGQWSIWDAWFQFRELHRFSLCPVLTCTSSSIIFTVSPFHFHKYKWLTNTVATSK